MAFEVADYLRLGYSGQPLWAGLAVMMYVGAGIGMVGSPLALGGYFFINLAAVIALDQLVRAVSFLAIGVLFYAVRLGDL